MSLLGGFLRGTFYRSASENTTLHACVSYAPSSKSVCSVIPVFHMQHPAAGLYYHQNLDTKYGLLKGYH